MQLRDGIVTTVINLMSGLDAAKSRSRRVP